MRFLACVLFALIGLASVSAHIETTELDAFSDNVTDLNSLYQIEESPALLETEAAKGW